MAAPKVHENRPGDATLGPRDEQVEAVRRESAPARRAEPRARAVPA